MSTFQRIAHQAVAAAWKCALLVGLVSMVGCGPGTGGTGSGSTSSPLDLFGAVPANICASGPSSALACPTPINPGTVDMETPQPAVNGTDGVLFSTTEGADIELVLTQNRATLNDRCLNLVFEGDWGTLAGANARFFGQHTIGSSAVPILSSLTVQEVDAEIKGLDVTLRDADGRVVIGPVTLRRVLAPTSNPAACNR